MLLSFFYLTLINNVVYNIYDSYKLWTVKSVVHDYYENLNEGCCSWLLQKILMKNVVHDYCKNLNEECCSWLLQKS